VDYSSFIEAKSDRPVFGSAPNIGMSDHLFPHQTDLVGWALAKGRAALFADTGLGKTAMQVEWARHVSSVGRVLIVAPLAVCSQTVDEASRFGVPVVYLREDDGNTKIAITNYEMVEHFDPGEFVGVALDESSILKSFNGKMRNALIGAFAGTPYRLACTATPAPNDFTELGNHSEFLGVKSRTEMLAEYFCHDGGSTQDWRLKGHAVADFWRWVATWGAVVKHPRDLGYDDRRYDLPPIEMVEEVIPADHSENRDSGMLFAMAPRVIADQRRVRRTTMDERVAIAMRLCDDSDQHVIWCEYNDESDAMAKAIDGAVEVKGSDSPEEKAAKLIGFAHGKHRVMVTKPKIAGFGLNWQRCASVIFAGPSHSYEQTYQAIRRCWRFGQARDVRVTIIRSELESEVVGNYKSKAAAAETMAEEMVAFAAKSLISEIRATKQEWNEYQPSVDMCLPEWLKGE
jgi:superfamily II DNA or RNA helicase